jgi:hypothetical protein
VAGRHHVLGLLAADGVSIHHTRESSSSPFPAIPLLIATHLEP